jgi:2-amino-4-hydroxy-6-hydroxymethyldihydropteridine diphosphokinase
MINKLNAYVALGSNLDNPRQQVLRAMDAIDKIPGCKVLKRSSLHETLPVGYADQPNFINAVIQLETNLSPVELLHALQEIEKQQGRIRTIKNGPRTLDCDLIWIDGVRINSEELILPHPRMHEREFVMKPILEIEPTWSQQ